MLPSIENLRCFLLASRLLNFRKAARSAALTPAAFGQRIRHLEHELGVELFQRTTRSVTLTEAGMGLVPHAERAIGAVEECVRSARGETGPPPMELTLGTRHELGLSWLLPQYETLVANRPGLNLHLYFGSGSDLVLRVRTMEVDCAVISTRISDPKLDTIRLHKEEYVLVASRALLAKNPLKRPEQAENHVLIDIGAEMPLFRYWRDAPGGGDRLRFRHGTWFGTIEAIRRAVVGGAGVAVLPEYLVRGDLAKKTLVTVFPSVKPVSDFFRLVFRADDPRRSVYESMARSLLEVPLA
jgi:LysR family glycine cleavage system transcriptional activator